MPGRGNVTPGLFHRLRGSLTSHLLLERWHYWMTYNSPNSSCCFLPLAFCPSCSFWARMPYPRLLPCSLPPGEHQLRLSIPRACVLPGGLTFPSPPPTVLYAGFYQPADNLFHTINCNKFALLCPHCDFSKGGNRVLFTSEFLEPGTQRRPKYLLNW